MRTWHRAVILILLLVPSALLAWTWRSMPQLGFYHDDGLYWVGAKSLAGAQGYHILSLPDQPYQTKYPPLLPALLAVVWKLNPAFPANLPLAVLFLWCVFPIFLTLFWQLLDRYGFGVREQVVLTGLAAMNPMAALLSMSMMPELLFTTLLLAAFLVVDRPILRGVLGGLAYLAKSAALPLLIAAPLCYALRRQYRRALLFVAAMAPAVVAWQLWVQAHVSKSQDLVTLYYTNYLGFQAYNVSWQDLPRVVWYNLDSLLMAIGKILTFDIAIFESKHLERVVAIAAIAGLIRLAKRNRDWDYPIFAGGFALMLLVWHYQPDQRFVFPLYPLLLAGLWTELKNVAGALQAAWKKPAVPDRVAAAVFASVLGAFAVFFLCAHVYGLLVFVPNVLAAYQEDLKARVPAYQWLAQTSPEHSTVFAYDDPLVYLYTGRRACNLPIPTKLFYHDDQAGLDQMVNTIPAFSTAHRLDYLLLTPTDFYRDLHTERARRLMRVVRNTPRLTEVYASPAAAIFALPAKPW